MRKFLLCSLIISSAMSYAVAQSSSPVLLPSSEAMQSAPAKAESQKFNIQYCGNEVGGWKGYYPEDCASVTAYIYVPADQATKLAGNKITGLTLSVVPGAEETSTAKGIVFISEDITEAPLYQVNMTYKNCYYLDGYKQEAQFPRSKQYEIKENTPFYFGYTVNFGESNPYLLLGFDKLLANESFSGTVAATKENGAVDVFDGKDIFKGQDNEFHNLYLYAMSEGQPLDTDQFSIGKFWIGNWTTPTFDQEHMMPMKVEIDNTGATEITSISYSYWFADNSAETSAVAQVNIPAATKGVAELPIDYPVGRNAVTVRIDKVNETGLKVLGNSNFFYLGETGYPAKLIVEKLTGTKCGYCPRGIYAFQYMERNYPEDFVGIEMMNYTSSEPFYCMSYGPIANRCSGAPSCLVNRAPNYNGVNITYGVLEEAYNLWKGQRSNGKIELEVECGTAINVTSHTTFAADDEHDYRIAYVVCENGLEATQTNNYAGSTDPIVGDWGGKGTRVSWTYECVAREVKDALGLYESTMHMPKKGETYDCSVSFDKRCLYNGDTSKAYVCALLIDATTGELITATNKALVEGGQEGSGIESVSIDHSEAVYYTIDGMKVSNPQDGRLYIKVANGKASKVKF